MVHMLMLQEGRTAYSVELVEVLVGVLVDVEDLQTEKTHLVYKTVFHEASAMVAHVDAARRPTKLLG